MRHLLSVLLALILAPIVYICAGFSAAWFAEATAQGDTDVAKGMLGLGAAVVGGALYAVLVLARLSPMGPVLAGLVYLGAGAWAVTQQNSFQNVVPANLFGVANVLHAAVPFGTSLLAVPLLITVFSPRRWRRTDQANQVAFDGAPVYPPSPGSAAPTYTTPAAAAPTYAPTLAYDPVNYDEAPTARDAPSLSSLVGFQPPQYASTPPSFPGFVTPPPKAEDDDPNAPR
jgi:hypothetical protein